MNTKLKSEIASILQEITDKRKELIALRKQLEPQIITDYVLKDQDEKDVLLSSLFDEKDELMVIHNMGKACSYCTLWADGFNGFTKPILDRMPFVLISPDAPAVQKEFSESRGWKFPMLSAHGSSFIKDLGFEPAPGKYWPGISALIRKDGIMYLTAQDSFGPGDDYCSVWHMFDLFPNGANGWHPKFVY